jgi:hypothetical protein
VATAAAVEPAGSTLSLDDFDVSLEDIEGGSEKEAVLPEAEPPRQEEQDGVAPPGEREEEMCQTEEYFEAPVFDDSPPAVTDLTPALEAVEELDGFDLLEGIEASEIETPEPALEAVEEPDGFELLEEIEASEIETTEPALQAEETVPSPSVAEGLPWEKEFREQFSARAQEIFEKVAAESVEKVMWEVVENLTKEFTGKIRESVEAVAWEVIPATAETLIREEIARIREQTGKESS